MRNKKAVLPVVPYIFWMTIFIVVPLILVVVAIQKTQNFFIFKGKTVIPSLGFMQQVKGGILTKVVELGSIAGVIHCQSNGWHRGRFILLDKNANPKLSITCGVCSRNIKRINLFASQGSPGIRVGFQRMGRNHTFIVYFK